MTALTRRRQPGKATDSMGSSLQTRERFVNLTEQSLDQKKKHCESLFNFSFYPTTITMVCSSSCNSNGGGTGLPKCPGSSESEPELNERPGNFLFYMRWLNRHTDDYDEMTVTTGVGVMDLTLLSEALL